jgi:hypothetical protein
MQASLWYGSMQISLSFTGLEYFEFQKQRFMGWAPTSHPGLAC